MSKLLGFNYKIVYKPGKLNVVADALSRKFSHDDEEASLFSLSTLQCEILKELRKENVSNQELSSLHQQIEQELVNKDFSNANGLVTFKGKLYIASDSPLKTILFSKFDSSPLGGHDEAHRTYRRLAKMFYWPNMRKEITEFVQKCAIFQYTKYLPTKPSGLILQPLPIPSIAWSEVTMDFITGLPQSKGHTVILVVIDRLTKYAHFGSLATGFTAATVAQLFCEIVVKDHGFPSSIVSDRDPIFLSNFWQQLLKKNGTTLKFSTTHHLEVDGQSEALNKCLEQYLRAFVFDKPHQWSSYLLWDEMWYNSSYHSSIQMTPYQALYGRSPSVIPHYSTDDIIVAAVEEALKDRNQLLNFLKEQLQKA